MPSGMVEGYGRQAGSDACLATIATCFAASRVDIRPARGARRQTGEQYVIGLL
jgi:hypothetical protein